MKMRFWDKLRATPTTTINQQIFEFGQQRFVETNQRQGTMVLRISSQPRLPDIQNPNLECPDLKAFVTCFVIRIYVSISGLSGFKSILCYLD